jgi:hypothetical protein
MENFPLDRHLEKRCRDKGDRVASKSGRARIIDFRRCLLEIPTPVKFSQIWLWATVTMENFPLEISTPVEFSQT